jgi:hypothetical protein
MSRIFQRPPSPLFRAGGALRQSRSFTLPASPVSSPRGTAELQDSVVRAQRFGHSLDRLLAPSPTAAPPIQRKLATEGLEDHGIDSEVLSDLLKSIQAFNEGEDSKEEKGSQTQIHGQIARLDAIERTANGWLRAEKGSVPPEARQAIFSLLSQTEEQHTELIHQTVQGGHELWLPESVGKEEGGETQELWKSLVHGKGNVQIRSEEKGFRREVHGSFAKLLEGKKGRKLLGDLNAPQKDEGRRIILDRDFSDKEDLFAKTDAQKQPEGSYSEPIARLEHQKGQPEDQKKQHELLPHNQPNVGTGSYVRLEDEPIPSDQDELQVGEGNEPIHAPRYITLGHELGHARRALRGKNRPDFWEKEDPENALWRNQEEKTNISQTENALRDEHDLPRRKFHTTVGAARATMTRKELNAELDKITESYKLAPSEIQDDLFEQLGLGELATAIDSGDMADSEKVAGIREKLSQTEKALPELIEKLSNQPREKKPQPVRKSPQASPPQQEGLLGRAGRFIGDNWKPLLAGGIGLAITGYAHWNRSQGNDDQP